MLKATIALLGVTATTAINVNDVDTTYFIGQFNGNEFPLSIGNCNPVDIFGNAGSQKAVCNSATSLTYTYYQSNLDCSGTATITTEYNSSSQTGTGTLYDFNCDSSYSSAYTEIEFAAFTCETGTKVTMYAAIGTCAFIEADDVSIQVYCNDDIAELYYFDDEDTTNGDYCGDADDVYEVANATDECGFMLETNSVSVYGQLISCVDSDDSGGSDSDSDSNTAQQTSFGLFGFLIVSVVAYLKL